MAPSRVAPACSAEGPGLRGRPGSLRHSQARTSRAVLPIPVQPGAGTTPTAGALAPPALCLATQPGLGSRSAVQGAGLPVKSQSASIPDSVGRVFGLQPLAPLLSAPSHPTRGSSATPEDPGLRHSFADGHWMPGLPCVPPGRSRCCPTGPPAPTPPEHAKPGPGRMWATVSPPGARPRRLRRRPGGIGAPKCFPICS